MISKKSKDILYCVRNWALVFLISYIPLFVGFYFHQKVSGNSLLVTNLIIIDMLWVAFMFSFLFPSSNTATDEEERFFVLTTALVHISLFSIFFISYCSIDMFIHPELYIHNK